MIFVPARFAADAIYEAVDAGIGTVICISEGLARARHAARLQLHPPARRDDDRAELPGRALAGQGERRDHPGGDLQRGLDRARLALGHADLPDRPRADRARARQLDDRRDRRRPGRRLVLHRRARAKFEADPETELVVMVGEIGGDEEEKAARFIAAEMSKPVVAYIAGFSAPPGKTMGHAGAIITGSSGTAQAKKEALEASGVRVGTSPTEAAQHRRRGRARLVADCRPRKTVALAQTQGSSRTRSGRGAATPTRGRSPMGRGVAASTAGRWRRSPSRAASPRPSACRSRSSPTARARPSSATGTTVLNYGPVGGYEPLREWVAERHGVAAGAGAGHERLAPGPVAPRRAPGRAGRRACSSRARPTTARCTSPRGTTASPSPLPMDDDGLDPDGIELPAAFLYTIPTFQNPSGRTLSLERRRALAELARDGQAARRRGRSVLARPLRGRARCRASTSSRAARASSTRSRSRRSSRPDSGSAT